MARRNDAGKIVPIYKGPFSLETTYEILDVVTLNGGSYISLIDNNIGNNLTNGNCWLQLTEGIKEINEVTNGLTHTYTIVYTNGNTYQFNVNDGYTPVKGVDYFTEKDVENLNIPRKITDLNDDSNFAKKDENNNFSTSQTITGDLTVTGNIVQQGESYETHAEVIKTKNDYVKLREGAEGGLADGEYTGLEAEKYDGNNNGRLVFDNTGTARVGDVGDEQPLATREESSNMADNEIVVWDEETQKLKTGDTNEIVRSVLPATANEIPEVLVPNTEYYLGEVESLSLAFPETAKLGQYCFVTFLSGTTATELTIDSTNAVGDIEIECETNAIYEIFAHWNGSKWLVQYLAYSE